MKITWRPVLALTALTLALVFGATAATSSADEKKEDEKPKTMFSSLEKGKVVAVRDTATGYRLIVLPADRDTIDAQTAGGRTVRIKAEYKVDEIAADHLVLRSVAEPTEELLLPRQSVQSIFVASKKRALQLPAGWPTESAAPPTYVNPFNPPYPYPGVPYPGVPRLY